MAAGLALAAAAAATAARGAEAVPLTVNTQEVTLAEFRWFMEQERAEVYARFKTRHHLEDDKDFWSTRIAGTTPSAFLQSNTITRIVREKTEQSLFQELGLVPDAGYVAFLAELEKYNQERDRAARQGRAVYGPLHYTQLQYYEHRRAVLRVQATDLLAKRWTPNEAELRQYYDRHRALFRASPSYTLEVVTIQAGVKSAPARTNAVRAVADRIQSKLSAGGDLPALLNEQRGHDAVKVVGQRFTELNSDRLSELFPDAQQSKAVETLAPGQTVLVADSEIQRRLVRCVAKTSEAERPYEAVLRQVKDRWLAQRYGQYLDRLAAEAQVRINQPLIDTLLP